MSRCCCFLLSLVMIGSGFSSVAMAQPNQAKVKKAEVQLFCPVFTDRSVGPESRSLRYRGIEIYFSSDLAARKWMRDPDSYLDKTILPQLGDLILSERVIPQHYCPVFPKRKVSVKDPSVMYQGQRVFLFDKEAVKIWNSAPQKFFNLDLLPQFPKPAPPAEGETTTQEDAEPPS